MTARFAYTPLLVRFFVSFQASYWSFVGLLNLVEYFVLPVCP